MRRGRGERLHQRSELEAGLAGEVSGFSCGVDQPVIGERRVSRRVTQLHVREQRWGQHADLVDGRCRPAEVQRVDDDATVGLGGTHHDLDRRCEVVGRPPGKELESDHDVVRRCQLAQRREAVDRPLAIVVGDLGQREPCAELAGALHHPGVVGGVVAGTDPRQLDIEDADAGLLSMIAGATDERGVGQQRRHFFVGCDLRQSKAHVVVSGRGRDVDHLVGRRSGDGQICQRELAPGHGTSVP